MILKKLDSKVSITKLTLLHDDNQYYGVYSRLASDHSNELEVIFPVWISSKKRWPFYEFFQPKMVDFNHFLTVQDDVVTRLFER